MTTVLVSTADMTRDEWLKERRRGIGGSDAAKVLGISRWGGPLSVWMEKTGRSEPPQAGEPAYWGTVLEDVVAREFEIRTGLKVRRENKMFAHPDYPWMIANVDRKIVGENQGLECKAVSSWKEDEWIDDNVPDHYYIQVQHYMAVMGWESCWIAALIGGQRFVWKEVTRNGPMIDQIIEKEMAFWQGYIETDVAPPIGVYDDPNEIYPAQAEEALVEPDEQMILTGRRLARIKSVIEQYQADHDYLVKVLKDVIQTKAGIKGVATWKQSKPKDVFDWKGLIRELDPPRDLIQKYTTQKPGERRFLLKIKEED